MKACTSRPRSPTKPMTTTSALVKRVIMPKSTLLPTPEPATKPTRCPRPSVNKPLIAFTPTSSTLSMGPRSMGLMGKPSKLKRALQAGLGLPSKGSPRPSITRPKSSGPRQAVPKSYAMRTEEPGPMPTGSVRGMRYKVLSLKPTTSASILWPSWPITSQLEPTGAMMPRASMRKPTKRTRVPQRSGLEARARDMVRATSAAKLVMSFPRSVFILWGL